MSNAYKFKNEAGIYFVTSTVVGWIDLFIRDVYKNILLDSIRYCQENKGLELFAWVLMTNHFHLIIRVKERFALSYIMRDMKKITSKRIVSTIKESNTESRKEWMLFLFERFGRYNPNNTNFQFWRQDNHPIELFGAKAIQQKLNYIHEKPVRVGFVFNAEDYVYSSAISYSGGKGLLDVILMD